MSIQKAICAFLLLLFSFTFVLNQDAEQTNDAKKSRENEAKALAQIEKVLEQAQLLKVAENRLHIKATVTDILWRRDEKRSRAIYAEGNGRIHFRYERH